MYDVQLTINRHRAEMGELHIKLFQEHQKTERQADVIERNGELMRDLHKELKVGRANWLLVA